MRFSLNPSAHINKLPQKLQICLPLFFLVKFCLHGYVQFIAFFMLIFILFTKHGVPVQWVSDRVLDALQMLLQYK